RRLVERHDVLVVVAVEVDDQQVAVEDRRGAGTAPVVAGQVAARPEDLARVGGEARGAVAAEVHVDAPVLDDRRRRGVAVVAAGVLRPRDVEGLDVEDDPAVLAIEGDGEELLALGRGRGEPHLLAEDHGGRPAAAVDARLPGDVAGLAPLARKTDGIGVAGAGGPPELRPAVGGARGAAARDGRREHGPRAPRGGPRPGRDCLTPLSYARVGVARARAASSR